MEKEYLQQFMNDVNGLSDADIAKMQAEMESLNNQSQKVEVVVCERQVHGNAINPNGFYYVNKSMEKALAAYAKDKGGVIYFSKLNDGSQEGNKAPIVISTEHVCGIMKYWSKESVAIEPVLPMINKYLEQGAKVFINTVSEKLDATKKGVPLYDVKQVTGIFVDVIYTDAGFFTQAQLMAQLPSNFEEVEGINKEDCVIGDEE